MSGLPGKAGGRPRRGTRWALAALAALALPPVVFGQQDGQGNRNVPNTHPNTQDPRGHELSRAQAVALVQRRYRARVVRTHLLLDPRGRPFYEFRLLSADGTVWTVHIDAYSGLELP